MGYDKLFNKCAHFLTLASLEDELAKLELPQDILDFVVNLSDLKHKGQVFSFIKKNNIKELAKVEEFLDELIAKENKKSELKVSEVPEELLPIYNNLPDGKVKAYFLRLCRTNKLPVDRTDLLEKFNTINHFIQENTNAQNIDNIEFDKLYKAAKDWEDSFTNVKIEEDDVTIDPSCIVFDDWTKPEFKGHFIYQIKTEDEMKLEGKLMNHCVGGETHTQGMLNGSELIFSLRTSSNKPLVTIETSPDMFTFRQTFGYGNREPSTEQMAMINEWKNSVHSKDVVLNLIESDNYQDKINAASFMDYNVPEYKVIIDYMMLEEVDSGKSNLGSNAQNEPKDVLQALANNTTLPLDYYYKIYDKCKRNLTTVYNILRNINIDSNLFKTIYNSNKDNARYVALVCSSINIKGEVEIIEEIFKKYNENKNIVQSLLNNPSVDSSTCRNIINNLYGYMLRDILTPDNIANMEGKLIDDLISSNRMIVKIESVELLVNNNNYSDTVLKKFYKMNNITPIVLSRNELVEELIDSNSDFMKNYIIKSYKDRDKDNDMMENSGVIAVAEYNRDLASMTSNAKIQNDLFDKDDSYIKEMLSINKNTNKDIQNKLYIDGLFNDKLLRNPGLDKSIQQKVIEDGDMDYMYSLASNENIDIEILDKLLSMNNERLNIILAGNPKVDGYRLDGLIRIGGPDISSQLAKKS